MSSFTRRRGFFHNTLHGLLVFVMLGALPLGWLAVKIRHARLEHKAAALIGARGGEATWSAAVGPAWLHKLLGDSDFLITVVDVNLVGTWVTDSDFPTLAVLENVEEFGVDNTAVSDNGIRYLRGMHHLKVLSLAWTKVSNAGMENLKELRNLEELTLLETNVGDAGVANLANLRHLRILNLQGTMVTDAGLKHLRGLSALQRLILHNDKGVTDAGLENLKGLKQLKLLWVVDTSVSAAGAKRLKTALPDCSIDCSTLRPKARGQKK